MQERKSFLLRIDPKLWRELEAWAEQEMRSINGQIELILKQAVARRRGEDEQQPPPAADRPRARR